MPDVERLFAGHSTVGRWTLAQILNHLANSIQYSIGGFPGRTTPWIVQVTFRKAARWSMLKRGAIPEGAPLPRGFVPQSDLNAAVEAEALREAIAAFERCESPVPHPFIGAMLKEDWRTFHCVHCGHHLSFAVAAE